MPLKLTELFEVARRERPELDGINRGMWVAVATIAVSFATIIMSLFVLIGRVF